jgi:hypothetical protein
MRAHPRVVLLLGIVGVMSVRSGVNDGRPTHTIIHQTAPLTGMTTLNKCSRVPAIAARQQAGIPLVNCDARGHCDPLNIPVSGNYTETYLQFGIRAGDESFAIVAAASDAVTLLCVYAQNQSQTQYILQAANGNADNVNGPDRRGSYIQWHVTSSSSASNVIVAIHSVALKLVPVSMQFSVSRIKTSVTRLPTRHNCTCRSHSVANDGTLFHGCPPDRRWCDVETWYDNSICPGAQRGKVGGNPYMGWDYCHEGVSGTKPRVYNHTAPTRPLKADNATNPLTVQSERGNDQCANRLIYLWGSAKDVCPDVLAAAYATCDTTVAAAADSLGDQFDFSMLAQYMGQPLGHLCPETCRMCNCALDVASGHGECNAGQECALGTDVADCFCRYSDDNVCDQGSVCPSRSDHADCSCPYLEDGICDEGQMCPYGSDSADCCPSIEDGICDEGRLCPHLSDRVDCFCPSNFNGACDENAGGCALMADFSDCDLLANDPAMLPSQQIYCPPYYEENGQCDAGALCPLHSDANECTEIMPEQQVPCITNTDCSSGFYCGIFSLYAYTRVCRRCDIKPHAAAVQQYTCSDFSDSVQIDSPSGPAGNAYEACKYCEHHQSYDLGQDPCAGDQHLQLRLYNSDGSGWNGGTYQLDVCSENAGVLECPQPNDLRPTLQCNQKTTVAKGSPLGRRSDISPVANPTIPRTSFIRNICPSWLDSSVCRFPTQHLHNHSCYRLTTWNPPTGASVEAPPPPLISWELVDTQRGTAAVLASGGYGTFLFSTRPYDELNTVSTGMGALQQDLLRHGCGGITVCRRDEVHVVMTVRPQDKQLWRRGLERWTLVSEPSSHDSVADNSASVAYNFPLCVAGAVPGTSNCVQVPSSGVLEYSLCIPRGATFRFSYFMSGGWSPSPWNLTVGGSLAARSFAYNQADEDLSAEPLCTDSVVDGACVQTQVLSTSSDGLCQVSTSTPVPVQPSPSSCANETRMCYQDDVCTAILRTGNRPTRAQLQACDASPVCAAWSACQSRCVYETVYKAPGSSSSQLDRCQLVTQIDCNGRCVQQTSQSRIGNSKCDDAFNCIEHSFDGGDCRAQRGIGWAVQTGETGEVNGAGSENTIGPWMSIGEGQRRQVLLDASGNLYTESTQDSDELRAFVATHEHAQQNDPCIDFRHLGAGWFICATGGGSLAFWHASIQDEIHTTPELKLSMSADGRIWGAAAAGGRGGFIDDYTNASYEEALSGLLEYSYCVQHGRPVCFTAADEDECSIGDTNDGGVWQIFEVANTQRQESTKGWRLVFFYQRPAAEWVLTYVVTANARIWSAHRGRYLRSEIFNASITTVSTDVEAEETTFDIAVTGHYNLWVNDKHLTSGDGTGQDLAGHFVADCVTKQTRVTIEGRCRRGQRVCAMMFETQVCGETLQTGPDWTCVVCDLGGHGACAQMHNASHDLKQLPPSESGGIVWSAPAVYKQGDNGTRTLHSQWDKRTRWIWASNATAQHIMCRLVWDRSTVAHSRNGTDNGVFGLGLCGSHETSCIVAYLGGTIALLLVVAGLCTGYRVRMKFERQISNALLVGLENGDSFGIIDLDGGEKQFQTSVLNHFDSDADAEAISSILQGSELDTLQIDNVIGRGGNSTVFQGTLEGQDVAIKLLKLDGVSAEAHEDTTKAFTAEIRIMAKLRHPNVVRLSLLYAVL